MATSFAVGGGVATTPLWGPAALTAGSYAWAQANFWAGEAMGLAARHPGAIEAASTLLPLGVNPKGYPTLPRTYPGAFAKILNFGPKMLDSAITPDEERGRRELLKCGTE